MLLCVIIASFLAFYSPIPLHLLKLFH
uniref:Uncharacterized protein n=1 Tax=Arundo donax TaxID=35708 RepID=A0A0A8Z6E1_ARUDO